MKMTCPEMSPLPTPLICPLRRMCITSYLGTRSPCRFHRKEAYSWLDQPFDEPMVLLDQVSQVFDQVSISTNSGSAPLALSSAMALGEAAFLSTVITRGVVV